MVRGEMFGGGAIQAAGSFVEDQYPGLREQCASDRDALFLPAGESHAAFADLGLVALRQGFDGAVDFRHLGIKGVSIALSFRISHLLFKIQNQIDLQLVYSVRALPLACPAFFARASRQRPHT